MQAQQDTSARSAAAAVIPTAVELDEAAVKGAIEAIDFSMVKMKLTHEKYGLGWTQEEADDAEKYYKMYLFLARKYPGAELVPNKHIDEFWHQHLLDTAAYAADCEAVFGELLHHYPYSGMLGDEDYANWSELVRMTHEIFHDEFGVNLSESGGKCQGWFPGGKCKKFQP